MKSLINTVLSTTTTEILAWLDIAVVGTVGVFFLLSIFKINKGLNERANANNDAEERRAYNKILWGVGQTILSILVAIVYFTFLRSFID